MALDAGTRLGAYEILAPIGAGGMGVVYRARDTKLKRDVAIKVLLASFADDEERLERLRREAQTLASLNHPHIAAIYGLEEEEGQPYLVLELVEGPTLSERMQQGSIPLDEALPIAKQMAEALAEAHEKPIIHRDLKPGNVKLTPDGRVKVLDFGLAKALVGDDGGSGASTDLAVAYAVAPGDGGGVILGTAAYMSPEQAKGKSVDRRTDVWAFGVVLYEMLTGKRLFHGDDVSEILAAVLRAEPDWTALPADTPTSIRRLLRRCLEKDRARRLDSMRAAWLDIEEAQQRPEEHASSPPRARTWTLALAVALGGLLAWALAPSEPGVPRPVTRFGLTLPAGSAYGDGLLTALAMSPDGAHLVYVAEGMLHLRAMDRGEPTPIHGTKGARTPFFSPDGQWLGFSAGTELKKISISGGTAVTLCEVDGVIQGASWNDDTIVFSVLQKGVYRVSAAGGTPEAVVPPELTVMGGNFGPQHLPGGNALLLTTSATNSLSGYQIIVYFLETGESRVLLEGGSDARYVATGHLVYGLGGSLLAVPFDSDRLEVTGGSVPLVDSVMMRSGVTQFAVSDTGALAYVPGDARDESRTLVWVDREGNSRPMTESRRSCNARPRLSPDGRRLAIQIDTAAGTDAWVLDLERDTLTRLTFEGGFRPMWTPDAGRIFFGAIRTAGVFDIFSTPADGSGSVEQHTEGDYRIPDSFSPDGKTLVFRRQGGATGRDIGVLSLDGRGEPVILLGTPFNEMHASVSPNGRWLAYSSDESGVREVYVQSFPELGSKKQVSTDGGTEPDWSRDGTELFYFDGDAMMAVAVSYETGFAPARPVKLFEGTYVKALDGVSQSYDVAQDGRFVMVRRETEGADSTGHQINVVLNWFEELKARVPTDE